MKIRTIIVAAIICLSFVTILSQSSTKPKVIVLGTFHFDNPGLDIVNTKIDDVFAPKRQKEILEIIRLLKKFKPTKIAIEANYGNQKIEQQYNDYLNNKYQLTRNEIDQIGYRLAKELGHKKIYPTDWSGNFDFEKVQDFAKINEQKEKLDELINIVKLRSDADEKFLQNHTFRQYFRKINLPATLQTDMEFYFHLVDFGKDENYVGTDVLTQWYERNLKIYTNIVRITENPNDRILVLYGAGHAFLLNQFLRDSRKYEIISPLKYL